MTSLDERVAYLEGKVEEHSRGFGELRDTIAHLSHEMDRRFDIVERRFASIDQRFAAIDLRFDGVDRRLQALDEKISRHFLWVVGIQIAVLLAVIGALLGS